MYEADSACDMTTDPYIVSVGALTPRDESVIEEDVDMTAELLTEIREQLNEIRRLLAEHADRYEYRMLPGDPGMLTQFGGATSAAYELTNEELWEILEVRAQYALKMSADEFIDRMNHGTLPDSGVVPHLAAIAQQIKDYDYP